MYNETSVHQANFVVNDEVFFFISFRQLLPPDIKCKNMIQVIGRSMHEIALLAPPNPPPVVLSMI